MKMIIKTGFFRIVVGLITMALLSLGCQSAMAQERESQIPLNQTPVLKYRVNIVPVVSRKSMVPDFVLGFLQNPVLFPEEGVVAETDEWGTLLDLFKVEVEETETLRLVEDCGSDVAAVMLPDYFLVFSYALQSGGRKIFCRLIESDSRSITLSCEGLGRDIRSAIKDVLSKIDQKLFMQAWRCKVESRDSQDRAIINRGHLDGVEIGLKLVGYRVSLTENKEKKLSRELQIMQAGKKSGLYEVVKISGNYAVVVARNKSSRLSTGDLLELPEVVIPKRKVESRGRKAWQGIYRK